MLKFLVEVPKIQALLDKCSSMEVYKFLLKIIPRIAFFFYWIFDMLVILGKIKVLPNINMAWVQLQWATFWTIANLSTIAD